MKKSKQRPAGTDKDIQEQKKWTAKYFKREEFACTCCGEVKIDQEMVNMLDYARRIAKTPFSINSGYRCPKHNAEVGGKETSSHLKGYAVDIKVTSMRSRFKILSALMDAGFERIGIAKTFIHVDNDPDKGPEVIWMY